MMRLDKTLFALIMLGSLAGCYPPSQSSYNPTVWEQPQPVHFFYGRLVAIRPAQIAYGGPAGFGAKVGLSPYLAGVQAGAAGPAGGIGVSGGFANIFFEASIPNVQALEYTVMLDRGSSPPDPYLDPREPTAPIIVVQNVYPFETAPQLNDHVAVRVVGKSARVIAGALPSAQPRGARGRLPGRHARGDVLSRGAPHRARVRGGNREALSEGRPPRRRLQPRRVRRRVEAVQPLEDHRRLRRDARDDHGGEDQPRPVAEGEGGARDRVRRAARCARRDADHPEAQAVGHRGDGPVHPQPRARESGDGSDAAEHPADRRSRRAAERRALRGPRGGSAAAARGHRTRPRAVQVRLSPPDAAPRSGTRLELPRDVARPVDGHERGRQVALVRRGHGRQAGGAARLHRRVPRDDPTQRQRVGRLCTCIRRMPARAAGREHEDRGRHREVRAHRQRQRGPRPQVRRRALRRAWRRPGAQLVHGEDVRPGAVSGVPDRETHLRPERHLQSRKDRRLPVVHLEPALRRGLQHA